MEPAELVQLNIYQSNTYRKNLKAGYMSTMSQWVKRGSKWRSNSLAYPFFVAYHQASMTTVPHTWPCGRFIEIQSNLRRKKLHRTNEGSNFLGGSFTNRDNVIATIQFRRKSHHPATTQPPPSILKEDFSSRTDPSIFSSIAPVFLDQSNETSWVFPV